MANKKRGRAIVVPVKPEPIKAKRVQVKHTDEQIYNQDMKALRKSWDKWPQSARKKPYFRPEGLRIFDR